jgi:predicted phage tail protein
MTKINIHGILGKIFGNSFELKISDCYSAMKGIDANRAGFLKKIFDLSANNQNYYIVIDGVMIENKDEFTEKREIKTIDFIPAIYGYGAAIAPLLVSGVIAQAVVAFAINAAISAGISFGISLITESMNKRASPPQQMIAVGGAVTSVEAKGRSYIFTNWTNLVAQGTSIPVGYGKMRIASRVIHANTKSYPTSFSFSDASNLNDKDLINYF